MVQYFKHNDGEYAQASPELLDASRLSRNWMDILMRIVKVMVLFIPTLVYEAVLFLAGMEKKSIKGQIALVTGGGNGLGRALCLQLAKEGCNVAVADIDFIAAENTAQQVREYGVRSLPLKVDVGVQQSVQQLKLDVEAKLGPVDILINNAGLLALLSLSEGTPEDVQRIIDVNLTSHFWTIRAFKDGMMERRRGHIMGVSSTFGIVAFGRAVCYSATKYGVRGLMEALNEEFYANGYANEIFTTCLYPGFVATRMELLEYLNQQGCRFPLQTPNTVAELAIEGLLRNRFEIITLPIYLRLAMKIYHIMPVGVTRLVGEIFSNNAPQP
ncbi:uncharacterized oxidoreductase YoxD-like [Toxorhynchites rutilus septentrionalis]|uniref:uncharacterized oxidoreductase YoxD-like n=1 Tax=Toxorhynchites rutilus septentrionalis TaxID=329112 RepID=UPI00247921BA|nr:uncharacterized oxidoreductase YoxD-like [Toxorhynchites rutilus septentrionalis]